MHQLKNITRYLDQYKHTVLHKSERQYLFATSSLPADGVYQDGVIYVLPASCLPPLPPEKSGACFFLICDTPVQAEAVGSADTVLFEQDTDASALLRDTQEIIGMYRRLQAAQEELLSILPRENSLSELVDIAHRFWGNPLLLRDMSFRPLIVRERDEILSIKYNMLEKLTPEGYANPDYLRQPELHQRQNLVKEAGVPLFFDKLGERRIMGEIYGDQGAVAHLIVYEKHRLFSNADLEFAKLFVKVLGIEFQKATHARSLQFPHSTFLQDILDGKLAESSIQKLSPIFRWSLHGIYFVAVATIGSQDQSNVVLKSSEQAIYVSTANELSPRFPDMRATLYRDKLVMVFNFSQPAEAQRIRQKLKEYLARTPVKIGVSDLFTELSRAGKYHAQALAVLEFERQAKSGEKLFCFDSYYFDCLFSQLTPGLMKQFCIQEAWAAFHYDQAYGTDLCHTVFLYLDEGLNPAAVAQQLGVHRNTVAYRINRFAQQTGFDFTRGDNITRLYLSLLILQRISGLSSAARPR